MKIVLAFDSFKGNIPAREVCEIVRDGIKSVRPEIETVILPMADGGEGTAEAMMAALGGEWIPVTVTGPLPTMKVDAGFAWFSAEKTAVVEMAAASGLPLLKPDEYNPMVATTYGTGELIKAAIDKGAERILLTVGGSATVDGGVGAAEALGWKFPESGEIVPPENLQLPEVDVLCDVTNPLCGPNGAAHVYGPQKGATPEMVEQLDSRLRKLSEKIIRSLGKDVRDLPGAGAAGGLAAGAVAFMNGKLVSGVDTVMSTIGLPAALRGAAWVLTGEGKFDAQSVQGKVVDGVARLAAQAGVKTGVIAGCILLSEAEWRAAGISFAATLQPEGMSVEESIRRSRELLFAAAAAFARDL
ncbi:MAG: glycerate 2-kinase [Verrucomicrobiota bacterium]|jgi:glycerate kinase|nr:glycerate 2-kinase [Verrucomicrobiota bacterium]